MSIVAISLKMYFTPERTEGYVRGVVDALRHHEGVGGGDITTAIIPDFLSIRESLTAVAGTPIQIGAQDLCPEDRGAFTGEVSGLDLAELGVTCVEVGHFERRTIFREDEEMVRAKATAALRNGLIPILCVGEDALSSPDVAAQVCLEQLESAIPDSQQEIWVAYEPYWAIGAPAPAPSPYVREVCSALKAAIGETHPSARVIYGGSAGPGLLTELAPSVDGIFIGRFGHDPAALVSIVNEATALRVG